jgi:hypothetical protein
MDDSRQTVADPPKRVETTGRGASRPVEDESGVVPGTTATRRPPDGGPAGRLKTRAESCLVQQRLGDHRTGGQWDTSDHAWLEGRGEDILLINMIDDATSRWLARFVSSDSTVENMNVLERYLQERGRPLEYFALDYAAPWCALRNAAKDRWPCDSAIGISPFRSATSGPK